jgi:hypothetical protein
MATLIYATNVSLDGYIEDEHGAFDLFKPDDDYGSAILAPSQQVRTGDR